MNKSTRREISALRAEVEALRAEVEALRSPTVPITYTTHGPQYWWQTQPTCEWTTGKVA